MTKVTLYDYQEEAYKKIVEKFKKSSTALVVMATGLGKTILAAFWAGKEIQERKRGLFLCHDTGILDQAVDEFKFVLGDEVRFAKFYGVNGNREEVSLADIVFSSFQTMKNNVDFFGREWFDFVIVDESHHGQASTYKRVINHFNPKKLLGITATPNRMDLKNIREIFGEEVVNYLLEEAIAKNWLVPIEYRVITDSLKLDNLKKIIQKVKERGERPSVQELDRMLFGKLSDTDIVKTIRQYGGDKKRTIVFCHSIEETEKMKSMLPKSESCHSDKDRECVNEYIEKLRTGELIYLTAVNQLNEGIDVPTAEIIALNRKTSSTTIWFQQIGRGSRKYDGKQKILVLDFVANCGRLIAVKKMVNEIKEIGEKAGEGGGNVIHNIESDFIFTDEQIDVIELLRSIKGSFYPTWQEASRVAIELGIKNQADYYRNYKKCPRLPSIPHRVYADFPGMRIFLGKKDKDFYPTWQEARNASVRLGFKKVLDYKKNHNKDPHLPSTPDKVYVDFPGWKVFLGKTDGRFYPTWQEASRVAIELGIKNSADYKKNHKKNSRLPSNPYQVYFDFPGWKVFLDKCFYPTWQEASRVAIELGIKNQADYYRNYKKCPRLYSSPHQFYPDFPGWKVFLGKE